MIHVQTRDCCPTDRRPPGQADAALFPDEVVVPTLVAWIVQGDQLARCRIDCFCVGLFISIASRAGQTQIVGNVLPAQVARTDVVHLMKETGEPFRALAILAASPGALADQIAQGWGNVGGHLRIL